MCYLNAIYIYIYIHIANDLWFPWCVVHPSFKQGYHSCQKQFLLRQAWLRRSTEQAARGNNEFLFQLSEWLCCLSDCAYSYNGCVFLLIAPIATTAAQQTQYALCSRYGCDKLSSPCSVRQFGPQVCKQAQASSSSQVLQVGHWWTCRDKTKQKRCATIQCEIQRTVEQPASFQNTTQHSIHDNPTQTFSCSIGICSTQVWA